jgi:hypothetical protein
MLTIFTSVGQITGTAVIGLLFASGMEGAFGTIFRGIAVLTAVMLLLSLRLEGKVQVARPGV